MNALIVDETAVNAREKAGWCVASLGPLRPVLFVIVKSASELGMVSRYRCKR